MLKLLSHFMQLEGPQLGGMLPVGTGAKIITLTEPELVLAIALEVVVVLRVIIVGAHPTLDELVQYVHPGEQAKMINLM